MSAVERAAYLWRYAIVTPGADVAAAEQALVEAVDELEESRVAAADAEVAFVLCDHPRLVPRYPCPACAPRYAAYAERRART